MKRSKVVGIAIVGIALLGFFSAGCFGPSVEVQQQQTLQKINENVNKETDVAVLLARGNAYRNNVLAWQYGADSYQGKLAKSFYRRALDLDPNNVEAMISIGILHVLHKPEVAQSWAKKALAIEPANADAHFVIAMGFAVQERYGKAIGKLQELETNKNLPERNRSYFYLWWAYCLVQQGKEADSQKMYAKAVELEEPIEAATYARDYLYYGASGSGSGHGGGMFEMSE